MVALATAAAPAAAAATGAGEMQREPSAANLRFMAYAGELQKTGHGKESTTAQAGAN